VKEDNVPHPAIPPTVQYGGEVGEVIVGSLIITVPLQAYLMYVKSIPTFLSL
jgi:hypothetical protein